jgi:hypothetical protein
MTEDQTIRNLTQPELERPQIQDNMKLDDPKSNPTRTQQPETQN